MAFQRREEQRLLGAVPRRAFLAGGLQRQQILIRLQNFRQAEDEAGLPFGRGDPPLPAAGVEIFLGSGGQGCEEPLEEGELAAVLRQGLRQRPAGPLLGAEQWATLLYD